MPLRTKHKPITSQSSPLYVRFFTRESRAICQKVLRDPKGQVGSYLNNITIRDMGYSKKIYIKF